METNSIIEILELAETHLQNEEASYALGKIQFLKRDLQREVDFIELQGGNNNNV
jgi:hypothetical protein